VNLLRLAGTADQLRRYGGEVLRGARIANAQSEHGGATVAEVTTTLQPTGDGFRIDGAKYYCTGSLFADILAVLTRLDDPHGISGLGAGEYIAYLPAQSAGVQIVDDWDALGQRTTGSGTVTFDGLVVRPDQLVARADAVNAPTGYGAFAQLLHAAIDAGIARGALETATQFVRTRSRPWFEAKAERAIDDPLTIQRFGELSVTVAAAEATLATAGAAVDAVTTLPPRVLQSAPPSRSPPRRSCPTRQPTRWPARCSRSAELEAWQRARIWITSGATRAPIRCTTPSGGSTNTSAVRCYTAHRRRFVE
jgi:alkylation response protein AidB-like acyl-CoA dehydrogenase